MATVRSAGWKTDEASGTQVFVAEVEYTGGDDMPDFEVSVIWKAKPVRIIVLDEQSTNINHRR